MRSKSGGAASLPPNPGVGPGQASLGNPKAQSGSRRDVIRNEGADAGGELEQTGKFGTSTNFEGETSRNSASKGSGASVPDPSILNRGYTPNTGSGPGVDEDVSANRLFGIAAPDPVLTGDTSTESAPVKPSYGSGTSAD